jgi:hypothetical protein
MRKKTIMTTTATTAATATAVEAEQTAAHC